MAENTKPKKTKTKVERVSKPAIDPNSREKQLISLAVDLAEKQLIAGTASPSIINHYLKMASSREVIEREKLSKELTLISAKAEAITSSKEVALLTQQAIDAMRNYGPKE